MDVADSSKNKFWTCGITLFLSKYDFVKARLPKEKYIPVYIFTRPNNITFNVCFKWQFISVSVRYCHCLEYRSEL